MEKMKNCSEKVLVIGNGFDLHHGMMTSYADMLRFYICIRDNIKQYELDADVLKTVRRWSKNSFFDYFVSEYEDRKDVKTWIDLEHGIKQYIRTVIDYFGHLNNRVTWI